MGSVSPLFFSSSFWVGGVGVGGRSQCIQVKCVRCSAGKLSVLGVQQVG